MKVLVHGDKAAATEEDVLAELDRLHAIEPITCIVQGGMQGVGRHAREWTGKNKVQCVTYHANWTAFGAAAVGLRDQYMLRDARADVVLLFDLVNDSFVQCAGDANVIVYKVGEWKG